MATDASNPFADVPDAAAHDDGVGNPFAATPPARPPLHRTRSRSLNDVRASAPAPPARTPAAGWTATAAPSASPGRARRGSVSLHRVTSAPNHAPAGRTAAPASSSSSSASSPSSTEPPAESPRHTEKRRGVPKFLRFSKKRRRRHTAAVDSGPTQPSSSRAPAVATGDDATDSTSSEAGASSSSGSVWVRAAKTNEIQARTRHRARRASVGLHHRAGTSPAAAPDPPALGDARAAADGRHARQTSAPILRPALHQALARADRAGKSAESAAARADAATRQLRYAGSQVRSTVHDLQSALGQNAVFASPSDVATLQRDAQRGRHRLRASATWEEADDSHEGGSGDEDDAQATQATKATKATEARARSQIIETPGRRTTVRLEYPPFQRHAQPHITIETRDGEGGGRTAATSEGAEAACDTAALQATLQPLVAPVTRTHLKQAREALLDGDDARTRRSDTSASSSSSSSRSSRSSSSQSAATLLPTTTTTTTTTTSSESEDGTDALARLLSDEDSLLTASSDADDEEGAAGDDGTSLLLHVLNAQFRAARRQQRRDLAALATLVEQRTDRRWKRAQREEARARADAQREIAAGVRRASRATRAALRAQHKQTRAALARERETSARALAHVLAALEALVAPVEQQIATTDLFRRATEDIQAVVGAQHELTKRRFARLTEEHDAIRRRDTARIRALETHAATLQRENEQLRFELRRDQRVLQDMFQARRGYKGAGSRIEALPGPDQAGSSSSSSSSSTADAPPPRARSGRRALRARASQIFRAPPKR